MKKVLLTLMALLTIVCGTNAKTVETTLWNDTYTDGVELSGETVATFKAGDVLRVYVTVPEGGANFKIVYKGASNGWAETTIPSLDTQWPWVNGDEAYKDIAFTAADITAFSGNNIYIYKGENSTITKVTLITTEPDNDAVQTLWEDTYTDGVELGSETVATFKAGDVLRVYVTVPEGGANFKIVYKGASNDWAETTIPSLDTQWPWVNGDETYKDITFTAADIIAFAGNNIYIYQGENSTITKVTLITTGAGDDPTPPSTDGDYTVTINEASNGTVTTDKAKADQGSTVTLTVTPATNYKLTKLRIDEVAGDPNGDTPSLARRRVNGIVIAGDIEYTKVNETTYTFVMPGNNVEITATFTNKPVAEPTFVYDDANNKVTVKLSGADDDFAANAKIYYTTDGSDPKTSTTRQESTTDVDITVTNGMAVVKAVGVDSEGNMSEVASQEVSLVRYLTVSKQWTAFYSPETFALPEGLKAYTIESVTQPEGTEEGTVTLKEQTVIAKNIPMVIENTVLENSTTKFRIANTDDVEIPASDMCDEFKGVAAATSLTSDYVYYVLKDGVFLRTNPGTVNAYNCYLQFDKESTPANARRFSIIFGNNTTGVQTVRTAGVDGDTWYNLNGAQVLKPSQRGIYIRNGKKIVFK